MKPSDAKNAALIELLALLCDGKIGPAEIERLDALLFNDPAAQEYYCRYIALDVELAWRASGRPATVPIPGGKDLLLGEEMPGFRVQGAGLGVQGAEVTSGESRVEDAKPPLVSVPPLNLLTTAYHGTANFFSQDVPFACMMATLIVGFALVIASFITKEHYTQMPGLAASAERSYEDANAADKANAAAKEEEKVPWVGRITGMVDCKWSADEGFYPPSSYDVVLGRKYKLDSGLMEITYDTGAKVIIQGPCTYEVDSATGGYLSLGKLTARVENKGAGEGKAQGSRSKVQSPTSESLNLEPLALNLPSPLPSALRLPPSSPAPLFAVRTPTAVVTDLGTEFGVEVSKEGRSEVHVLQGVVDAVFHRVGEPADAENLKPVRLTQGMALRYNPTLARAEPISLARNDYSRLKILRPDERRQRWLDYSKKLRLDPTLVAYYTFESENVGSAVLRNESAAGPALDGRIEGAFWQSGRFPGKPSLWFRGRGFDDHVELPEESRFDFPGSFSIALWFKAGNPSDFPAWSELINKGDTAWMLRRFGNWERILFDSFVPGGSLDDFHTVRVKSQEDIIDGQWHFMVALFESDGTSSSKRLYLDGRLDAEAKSPPALQTNDAPVWIGNSCDHADTSAWCGWIDEAAIFARALSGQEIQEMYSAGDPLRAVPGDETKPDNNIVLGKKEGRDKKSQGGPIAAQPRQ